MTGILIMALRKVRASLAIRMNGAMKEISSTIISKVFLKSIFLQKTG
jgi:hypothetical protein